MTFPKEQKLSVLELLKLGYQQKEEEKVQDSKPAISVEVTQTNKK